MLKRVQHDIWSHLLFILSFLGNQFNTYVGNSKIINPKLKKSTANSTKKPFCKENAKVLQRMQSVSYILSITYDTFCVFAFLRFYFHHRNAASLGISQASLTLLSLLCILQNSIIKQRHQFAGASIHVFVNVFR